MRSPSLCSPSLPKSTRCLCSAPKRKGLVPPAPPFSSRSAVFSSAFLPHRIFLVQTSFRARFCSSHEYRSRITSDAWLEILLLRPRCWSLLSLLSCSFDFDFWSAASIEDALTGATGRESVRDTTLLAVGTTAFAFIGVTLEANVSSVACRPRCRRDLRGTASGLSSSSSSSSECDSSSSSSSSSSSTSATSGPSTSGPFAEQDEFCFDRRPARRPRWRRSSPRQFGGVLDPTKSSSSLPLACIDTDDAEPLLVLPVAPGSSGVLNIVDGCDGICEQDDATTNDGCVDCATELSTAPAPAAAPTTTASASSPSSSSEKL
mmetsp:Transcript_25782/g.64990  ORF Transcript_25782/g.64990 Transcript_25782/m.64990 type:complete len:319 (-) Transcript_25782:2833-3789(-)